MAAWNTVTDVNDGQSFGGAAWQSAIDAVVQIQGVLGTDDTPIVGPLADRIMVPAISAIDDDTSLLLTMGTGVIRGLLVIVGNTSASGQALVAFRTGDASAFTTVVASAGATVTGGVGFLAGTTGPDASLNINTRTDLTRIHLENRTGSVKGYTFSFLAITGSFDPASAWA